MRLCEGCEIKLLLLWKREATTLRVQILLVPDSVQPLAVAGTLSSCGGVPRLRRSWKVQGSPMYLVRCAPKTSPAFACSTVPVWKQNGSETPDALHWHQIYWTKYHAECKAVLQICCFLQLQLQLKFVSHFKWFSTVDGLGLIFHKP